VSVIGTQEPTSSTVREDLLPVAQAPRRARDIVTDACLRWGLPHLIGPAALIISELVSNAVDHAETMMTVEVARGEKDLRLAVHDGSSAPPIVRVVTDRTVPMRGRGLMLVAAAATTWGYSYEDGGKSVWATIAFDSRP
jgi:anti-sigma regulatory factor (Ser/Thr protein kinase)